MERVMTGAFGRAVLGIALLSAMDALIKAVAARYPTFEITFLRFACGTLVAGAVLAVRRPGWPTRETVVANSWRALLVVVTATSFFYALGRLPLAEAQALAFLAPVFIAFFGVVLLRERIDGRIVVALLAGFAGMVIIVHGSGTSGGARSWDGIAAALAAAVTYALSMVMLRARATRDRVETIVFFQNIGPALVLAAPAGAVWVPPHVSDLSLFLAIGCLGAIGHLILATAFARVEAARLAPLEYTALIWAVALGYLFFGEVPSLQTLAGGALIVLGALATVRR
ncbi:transporter [Chelatococcus daeguensis]|uniref:Transporter n=2 Tax=Chelatococcaceae TaxID=2036754 RepID=A0AAC9JR94_9HYPH|nr:transporter [Chelatococcus daeguensis]